jgi:3-hydroxyacyl-CoA dehydrogenase/enoyl-CoA hydratase/3-hydroxybutyryl-CoA epimerase
MCAVRKYKNMYVETDVNNILWLYLDKENSSSNVLSKEVMEELDLCIEFIENEKPNGLVILSAKKSGFVFGADVNEFVGIKDEVSALNFIKRGQSIFSRIEKLPFPTVAAIHGFCLGGGTELVLSCKYRVAQEDENTQLGLPEIKLGIHPGFGGCVRGMRLLGGLSALDIILTGRSVKAKAAKRMGLVDLTAPARHLKTAALGLITSPPRPRKKGFVEKLADSVLFRPFVAGIISRKTAEKANPAHYPSPFAVIELWKNFCGDWDRMMDEEAKSVARLIVGRTAQNLVRVFQLQDKMKAQGKKSAQKINNLHVVGAGAMGGDIAAWSASKGIFTTLQDREPKFVSPAIKRGFGLFSKRLKEKRFVQAAMDRFMPDVKGDGAIKADLVIEAIFENADAKRALFKDMESKAKPGAILATNTSSIPLEEITTALSRPENLVGIHFFNPVPQMMLVEIVKGAQTSNEAMEKAFAYVTQIGKLPLAVKSSPGFLVNRILVPYLLEGILMESEGVPKTAIDKAATDFGMPMGPLFLADTVGLDICLHVGKIFSTHMGMSVPERLESLVKAGNIGKKSGKGFYEYRGGKKAPPSSEPKNPLDMNTVRDRLILRYLNECVACLREGIVESADMLDAGMIFGSGFAPFYGGPIKYATDEGAAGIVETLGELEKKYGPRFKPDSGWKQLANSRG